MNLIVKGRNFIKNRYMDFKVRPYLRYNALKKHSADKPVKVAFIVFEPETWDKEAPIYDELKKRKINADLIVVPSFDRELRLTKRYGKELDFFKGYDADAIRAYDDKENIIDLKSMSYDYVFYQDPYNEHMPAELRSDYVVQFAKICYVPYGYSGSNAFNGGNTNRSFFRNVFWGFMDVTEVRDILIKKYRKNCNNGLQNFICTGYPSFEKFFDIKWDGKIKRILWAPRWSYEPKTGGSHFIEYKDNFVALKSELPEYDLAIRPHPMMFSNFINKGLITESIKDAFISELDKQGIELSQNNSLMDDFMSADILITDFSSIIPMFYLTEKPIIYCKSDIEFNNAYKEMAPGMYIAESWSDVKKYIHEIVGGNDYLRSVRKEIIKQIYDRNVNATSKIVDIIINDYNQSST